MTSFNTFALEQINDMPISVGFPSEGNVFDYYLDFQNYRFEPWSKRKGRLSVRHSGYVPTAELSCVAYIAELYLSYGYNVMLMGERGSGKSSLAQVHIRICTKSQRLLTIFINHTINFTVSASDQHVSDEVFHHSFHVGLTTPHCTLK